MKTLTVEFSRQKSFAAMIDGSIRPTHSVVASIWYEGMSYDVSENMDYFMRGHPVEVSRVGGEWVKSDLNPVKIRSKSIEIGNTVLECFPYRLSDADNPKNEMYMSIVEQIRDFDMWSIIDDVLWVYRNNYEYGPNSLRLKDGKIVEARLFINDIDHNISEAVNPAGFTPDGMWLPEFEYLVRERIFDGVVDPKWSSYVNDRIR